MNAFVGLYENRPSKTTSDQSVTSRGGDDVDEDDDDHDEEEYDDDGGAAAGDDDGDDDEYEYGGEDDKDENDENEEDEDVEDRSLSSPKMNGKNIPTYTLGDSGLGYRPGVCCKILRYWLWKT